MAKKSTQYSFEGDVFKPRFEFGGALNKNSNPKVARSISTKNAMHVVLRSDLAKGQYSLINKSKAIKRIVEKQASKFHITVYNQANVGNHLHLLIYLQSNNHDYAKKCLNGFLRAISGIIARLVLDVEKGKAKGLQFWTYRPYTRIVVGFVRGYQIVKDYVLQNHLEALGIIPYRPRSKQKHRKLQVNSA